MGKVYDPELPLASSWCLLGGHGVPLASRQCFSRSNGGAFFSVEPFELLHPCF
jgi:hypothetical protein